MSDIRKTLTSEQRCEDLSFSIDPGFVHRVKIETRLGRKGMEVIDHFIGKLPEMPEGLMEARIDGIYSSVLLSVCNDVNAPPLFDALVKRQSSLFCSVEEFGPCPTLWDDIPRGSNEWIGPAGNTFSGHMEYSSNKVRSDTTRSRLVKGAKMAIVGDIVQFENNHAVIEPIVLGGPCIVPGKATFDSDWWSYDFFENFIEDIDEFKKVIDTPTPADSSVMKGVSENAFKQCLATILGGETPKDWGGETSDFYSAHLHIKGKRTTGAFLLKGPARFAPMNLAHLGKNNDQIVRLASEPAQILFVQHCHEILSPVRETLRVFSVQPCRARRYCLIDGRDSLRLLLAYDLLDTALKLSKKDS